MKKLFYLLLFLPLGVLAQTTTENYIVSKTYTTPVTDENALEAVPTDAVQTSIQYFDGLGRPKQSVALRAGGILKVENEAVYDWTLDNTGSTDFFNQNGNASENTIVNGETPFGDTDLLWECKPDIHSGPDGGWNSDYFAVDKTQTYHYSVWVKKTGNQHGVTFHGTRNVNNLNGTANNNPYFWSGDPPQLDTWYLIVGVIHPHNYTGGDTGVSGVYDTQGNKVRDGVEYTWRSNTTNTQLRSYLFYTTNSTARQYFWSPLFQKMDENALPLEDVITNPSVLKQETLAKDIVTHSAYDAFGRQTKEYLPYATLTHDGSIKTDAEQETRSFYQEKYTDDFVGITNPMDINAFSEKQFDGSPLNRVTKQAAPGKDWAMEGGHEIKFTYETNTQEEVRYYTATTSFSDNLYRPSLLEVGEGFYKANQLQKTITKDENWQESDGNNHTTEEFKNKQGQVVLKRTYNENAPHDTYYVYDDFGNLTYVLPPRINFKDGISATELSELGYQYKYDHRNRLVEKKIPSKGWEYIVYDKLDRPVLTQDANLRADNKWLFTKYDVFGRVAYTGEINNTGSRMYMGAILSSSTHLFESHTSSASVLAGTSVYYTNQATPIYPTNLFTINYYDSYTDLPTDFTAPTSVLGQAVTTNNKTLPTVQKTRVLDPLASSGQVYWITTVTYYDTKNRPIYVYSKNEYLQTTDIVESKLDFVSKVVETKTTHIKTGKEAIVTNDVFEYDHVGRLLEQTQKINDQVPTRIVKNKYDEMGQLESKLVGNGTKDGYADVASGMTIDKDVIKKTGGYGWNGGLATLGSFDKDGYVEYVNPQTNKWFMVGLSTTNSNASYNTINYAMYNAGSWVHIYESGRWKKNCGTILAGDVFRVERIGNKIYYKKNGEVLYISKTLSTEKLIGDLSMHTPNTIIKDLRIVDNSQGLQKVDYKYNVRGWLKNINEDSENDNDLFNFTLNYNDATQVDKRLYNGNISQTLWNTLNEDTSGKQYTYSYDALNRITRGEFKTLSSSGVYTSNYGEYDVENITYDKNGNILGLQRKANHTYHPIDDLVYTYDTGNKLLKVVDNGSSLHKHEGFKDGTNSGNDYSYDANGNMTVDKNKGITSIEYNHLNLPKKVSFGANSIHYVYDATGVKLKKILAEYDEDAITTIYAGNFVYNEQYSETELQFFNQPEGYVTPVILCL